jgi:hypothetical protein
MWSKHQGSCDNHAFLFWHSTESYWPFTAVLPVRLRISPSHVYLLYVSETGLPRRMSIGKVTDKINRCRPAGQHQACGFRPNGSGRMPNAGTHADSDPRRQVKGSDRGKVRGTLPVTQGYDLNDFPDQRYDRLLGQMMDL